MAWGCLAFLALEAPQVSGLDVGEILPKDEYLPPSTQERSLVTGLLEIRRGRLDTAMTNLASLVKEQPDFRLAKLVYADLLMAKAGRFHGFGNGGPRDLVSDLRHEARVRLQRYMDTPPPTFMPSNIIRLPEDIEAALVFDVQGHRLYIVGQQHGSLVRSDDFYTSIGKGGSEKQVEGDEKTPLGVYHVASYRPANSLPDLYGAGAFPISYPNNWDRQMGRTGSGIWIHGTESSTFSRPPLSSRGCLTLSNQDFVEVREDVRVGRTPVIVSSGLQWSSSEELEAARQSIASALESWRLDWESLDTERYLSHYSQSFRNRNTGFSQFAAHKKRVNRHKTYVQVDLSQVGIYRYPGERKTILVEFLQDYKSSNLNAQRRKHQYWRQEEGTWKIIFEGGT